MDKLGIGLKLFLNYFDISPIMKNYNRVADFLYVAQERSIHVLPQNFFYNPKIGHARHHFLEEMPGDPYSRNLFEFLEEIQYSHKESEGWKLDGNSLRKLNNLKRDVEKVGIEVLLKKI